jgi:hypothetical protein
MPMFLLIAEKLICAHAERAVFIDLDCVLEGIKVNVMFKTGLDIEGRKNRVQYGNQWSHKHC